MNKGWTGTRAADGVVAVMGASQVTAETRKAGPALRSQHQPDTRHHTQTAASGFTNSQPETRRHPPIPTSLIADSVSRSCRTGRAVSFVQNDQF